MIVRAIAFLAVVGLMVAGVIYLPQFLPTYEPQPIPDPVSVTETEPEPTPEEEKAAQKSDPAAVEVPSGNRMTIEVSGSVSGTIDIELFPEVAPLHVEQIKRLAAAGLYNGVAFHRVIPGFMAQTGDVEFGTREAYGQGNAGIGGSTLPDIPAEFSELPYERGIVGMARTSDPNTANSQFFIMYERVPSLDNQYTVIGQVLTGMDVVDQIAKGSGSSGAVTTPDFMETVTIRQ
ncbi:MAG: peptidylprolyl isomerase [Pseudomonadota bacterium]